MAFQRSSLRYAHTTGHTSLVYTEDGEYILTCGSDGDIRKWRGIDDDDPSSNCLGEFVMCIQHTGEQLLASTDRNTLQAYTFPALDNDGTLMRFTAPVTCLRVHKSYTVAGSEDTNIKVLKRDSDDVKDLQGHTGPVLALDICAKGELLASVAGDGHLKIWQLEQGKEVKSVSGLEKVNSFESAVCFGTPCFEPRNNNLLAYVKDKEICVLNTSSWELAFTLSDERVSGNYTCCRFSSDGQYLAAGTTSGEISVFDFARKQALKCEAPSSECQAITCLAWHPKSKELAYCDATGQLGTLFYGGKSDEAAANDLVQDEADVDFGDIEFDNDDAASTSAMNDDDDGDGVSIEKLKNKVMNSAKAFGDGEFPADDNSRDTVLSADIPEEPHLYTPKTFKQQAAFQPSATPITLEHRYLAWNDVGIVTAHSDSTDGSIDVEFHDASVHHSLHIPNYSNHDMASLSSNVLALSAIDGTKLVCIALAASGNKEWQVQLPDCERVEALAASDKLVAAATSMNFLRIFTVMGTQREVISVPGPVLAMAAHGERLLVCYHSAAPGALQPHLGALLIQINGMHLRTQHVPLPLPPERQMRWLGFSDCGSPVFADSMGLLQLFSMRSNCWFPICDTTKHSQSVSNNYFIIAVQERSQIVQAVLCRGCSYPMTSPRPMMQELSMHVPVCDPETEKTDLEDALMRTSFMAVDNPEKIIKESAIKLFALACRSETEPRAKELIETIGCPELLLLAVKYASKLGRIHLADRLSELMPQLEEQYQREKQQLHELQLQEHLALSPLIRAASPSFSRNCSSPGSTLLAPKSIELTLSKRAHFKRSSLARDPSHKSSLLSPSLPSTAASVEPTETEETQENLHTEQETQLESTAETTKEVTRTPLNSVNPFAAKRKLADVDFGKKGGVLFGSEKLKLVKK